MNERALANRDDTSLARWARDMIEAPSFQTELKKALSAHFNPERFNSVMLQALVQAPALQQCTPTSLKMAMLKCARLGIEPLGQYEGGWLIPRKGKAEFQISYDGLLRVVARTNDFLDARAFVVRENDEFIYEPSSPDQPIIHRIDHTMEDDQRGAICGAWCSIRLLKGGHVGIFPTFLRVEEIERRRRIGRGAQPAWKEHWDAMARKTVLHESFKLVPKELTAGASDFWVEEDDEPEAPAGVEGGEWQEQQPEPKSKVEAYRSTVKK